MYNFTQYSFSHKFHKYLTYHDNVFPCYAVRPNIHMKWRIHVLISFSFIISIQAIGKLSSTVNSVIFLYTSRLTYEYIS